MYKIGRYQANCLILAKLQRAIDKNPDMRFHQIMQNIGIESPAEDQWYEESEVTLDNITEAI